MTDDVTALQALLARQPDADIVRGRSGTLRRSAVESDCRCPKFA
jgi:hypothetical protein